MISDAVGPGLPLLAPKGRDGPFNSGALYRRHQRSLGYQHVSTPAIRPRRPLQTSGHWDHFKDNMYPPMEFER